jgi:hypothetical protein
MLLLLLLGLLRLLLKLFCHQFKSSNNVDNQATSQSMTLSAADLYNTSAFLGDLLGLAPASNSAKGRTSGLVKTYQVFF